MENSQSSPLTDSSFSPSPSSSSSPSSLSITSLDPLSIHRLTSSQVILDLPVAIKELIENSLDAHSTSIEIRLFNNGSNRIEVMDNGDGIPRESYANVGKKSYTNKIVNYEDINHLSSYGFRGEALSALCGISHSLYILTRTRVESSGNLLVFDHNGDLLHHYPHIPASVGTTIIINHLFLPYPVRYTHYINNIKKEYMKFLHDIEGYMMIKYKVKFQCTHYGDKYLEKEKGAKWKKSNEEIRRDMENLIKMPTPTSIFSSLSSPSSPPPISSLPFYTIDHKLYDRKTIFHTQGNLNNLRDALFNMYGNAVVEKLKYFKIILRTDEKKKRYEKRKGKENEGQPEEEKETESDDDDEISSKLLKSYRDSSLPQSDSSPSSSPTSSSSLSPSLPPEYVVSGYFSDPSKPQSGRSSSDRQFLYLNSRPFDSPPFTSFFNEIYRSSSTTALHSTIATSQYPNLFIHFQFPTESYDLNLSPDKREILFHDKSSIMFQIQREMVKQKIIHGEERTFHINEMRKGGSGSGNGNGNGNGRAEKHLKHVGNIRQSKPIEMEVEDGGEEEEEREKAVMEDKSSSFHRKRIKLEEDVNGKVHISHSPSISPTSIHSDSSSGCISDVQMQDDPPSLSPLSPSSSSSSPSSSYKKGQNDVNVKKEMGEVGNESDNESVEEIKENVRNPWKVKKEVAKEIEKEKVKEIPTPHTHHHKGGGTQEITNHRHNHNNRNNDDEDGEEEGVREPILSSPSSLPSGFTLSLYDPSSKSFSSVPPPSSLSSNDGKKRKILPPSPMISVISLPPSPTIQVKKYDYDENPSVSPLSTSSSSDNENFDSPASVVKTTHTISYDMQWDDMVNHPLYGGTRKAGGSEEKKQKKRSEMKMYDGEDDDGDGEYVYDDEDEHENVTMDDFLPVDNLSSSPSSPSLHPPSSSSRIVSKSDFRRMKIIGQFNVGFIISQLKSLPHTASSSSSPSSSPSPPPVLNDLYILDQHACDEKYRYEYLLSHVKIKSQPLISPLKLDLEPMMVAVAREHQEIIERNGFKLQFVEMEEEEEGEREGEDQYQKDHGNNDHPASPSLSPPSSSPTFRRLHSGVYLTAIPHSEKKEFGPSDVIELCSLLLNSPHTLPVNDPLFSSSSSSSPIRIPKLRHFLASRACRSSIMFGTSLTTSQMSQIVNKQMGQMSHPWCCPHGRPTMRHLCDVRGMEERREAERKNKMQWVKGRRKQNQKVEGEEEEENYDELWGEVPGEFEDLSLEQEEKKKESKRMSMSTLSSSSSSSPASSSSPSPSLSPIIDIEFDFTADETQEEHNHQH